MAVTEDKNRDADEQNQKHDEGYKGILSNSDTFSRFMKKYFPEESWTANISADDMERIDKSFITREYGHIDSDLIYKLKINGAEVYFYVLIELQSEVDFTMPFRLLRYMVELLNDIFKNTDENIRESKDFRLPAIVPVVLYNDEGRWTAARTYREYTEDYEIFGDSIIDFRYLLFDLNRTTEEAITPAESLLDVVFLTEKLRLDKKLSINALISLLDKWISNLPKNDQKILINWVRYVFLKGKILPEAEKNFENFLQKGEEAGMKFGLEIWADEMKEEWRSEGMREGMREGRSEGMREGRKLEALELARRLKTLGRMSVDEIAEATKLTVDDVLRL